MVTTDDLIAGLESLRHPRILVLGDLMLDRYVWGSAERISQEAPVIVLRADYREARLGGAANVCTMLRGLEADVDCAGAVGADEAGNAVCRLLEAGGIRHELVIVDPTRPTTTKERFIGRAETQYQLLRVDSESREPLDGEIEDALLSGLDAMTQYDAVLLSNYGKGVCTNRVVQATIETCRSAGVPVLIDPTRTDNFSRYRGATVLKPNRLAAESALGCRLNQPAEVCRVGDQLRKQLDLEALVVTLDGDGMVLIPRRGVPRIYASRHRAVRDIAGAGDAVLAVLGLAWASGLDAERAASLSQVAGSLEVEKLGAEIVKRSEIHDRVLEHSYEP